VLTTKSRVYKNKKVPWREVEEEAILVDISREEVVHLNEAATVIWGSIDGIKTVGQIIDGVYDSFCVDREQAQRDTLDILNKFIKRRLIALDIS
jgi:hypothetical protein